jgi:hypothetical protein
MSEEQPDKPTEEVVEVQEDVKRDKRGRIISKKKQEASRRNWEKAVASRKEKKQQKEETAEYDIGSDNESDDEDEQILNAIMAKKKYVPEKKQKKEKDYDDMSTAELQKVLERLERMEASQVELAKLMKKSVKRGGQKMVLIPPTSHQSAPKQTPKTQAPPNNHINDLLSAIHAKW